MASVLGFLNDVCKAADFGQSHLKYLEVDKITALGEVGFEGDMSISPRSIKDLTWWRDSAAFLFRKIRISAPTMVLCTDASSLGWGATCTGVCFAVGQYDCRFLFETSRWDEIL